MKRFWKITVAALLVLTLSAPAAFAWEFDLTGKWLWGIDYFSQAGPEGFFGPANLASVSGNTAGFPNYNGMNGFMGFRSVNQTQYGLVTGNDAALNWSRMEFYPEIRLNQAIRFRGLYSIGGNTTALGAAALGTYSLYVNSSQFGSYSNMDWGEWSQWWVTAQTPIGILVAGKRAGPFGIGVQYEGTMAQSESLAIVAPYGPFRFGAYCYPWREARWLQPMMNATATVNLSSRTNISVTTASPNQGGLGATGLAWTLPWDKEQIRNFQPGIFFTYSSGDFEFGALYEWWTQHATPAEAALGAQRPLLATYDQVAEDGTVYFKYFNGRFFFSSEVGWLRAGMTYQPPQTPGGAFLTPGPGGLTFTAPVIDPGDGLGSEYAPYNAEAWKLAIESGVICGPAKVSLFYSWVPGPDRRQGIWIRKQSWENVAGGRFLGNAQLFLPYSLLMSYQYGAGLNAVNQRGEGFMTDASSFGGRVDYSVAANLNVYGTFFYANRVSKGWGWGSLVPTSGRQVFLQGGFGSQGNLTATPNAFTINKNALGGGPGSPASPSIPDDSLGYEVTVGMDWKLLEGITLQMRGAYWNVGNWFKYACVDKSIVTFMPTGLAAAPLVGDGAAFGAQWGVYPGRALDPIYGFQAVMMVDF